jgi:hypothetical protein
VRVSYGLRKIIRRSNVPKNASNDPIAFPATDDLDQSRLVEPIMEDMGYSVEVADDHRLQDDTHVGSEKQPDVDVLHPTRVALVDHLHSCRKALEVYENQEDYSRAQQLTQIVAVLASEGLHHSLPRRGLGEQKVHEGHDGSLELHPELGGHRDRTECEPADGLARVRANKERNSGAQTIALPQHVVKQDHDQPCSHQLSDDQHHRQDGQIRRESVSSVPDGHHSFSEAENDREHSF